jgi:glutamate dehydrogenase (NADP+)
MPIKNVEELITILKKRDPDQPEFLQAAEEVILSLKPVLEKNQKYLQVMESLIEPERVIMFRVSWIDDSGNTQINRGFRIQFNSALGPYKGGLRLHPTVNLSVLKFLGFEQILKNALTGLPMGGAKGGSDFDPKGKSDNEVMRFCQSFMTELYRHIGPDTDVPAGDIGVGGREIGFLFGQYKRITNSFTGTLTGKGLSFGGSLLRPQATGYGVVFFAEEVMKIKQDTLKGKRCLVSGSGNVAQYCAEKLHQLGATVLTFSDSNGTVYESEGFTKDQIQIVMEIKNEKRGRIKEYLNFSKTAQYFDKKKPWSVKCDIAFPCATQNEINQEDAKELVKGGCKAVIEGANMPSTTEAIQVYSENKLIYVPGKASNAGGVATSGLEMSQNSMRLKWTEEEVSEKLHEIMKTIHANCYKSAKELGDEGNYQLGANIAGFQLVAEAMMSEGSV